MKVTGTPTGDFVVKLQSQDVSNSVDTKHKICVKPSMTVQKWFRATAAGFLIFALPQKQTNRNKPN